MLHRAKKPGIGYRKVVDHIVNYACENSLGGRLFKTSGPLIKMLKRFVFVIVDVQKYCVELSVTVR